MSRAINPKMEFLTAGMQCHGYTSMHHRVRTGEIYNRRSFILPLK